MNNNRTNVRMAGWALAVLLAPTPSPTRINMYTGTPASTPKVPLGAQWATYPPDRYPPTSTPAP